MFDVLSLGTACSLLPHSLPPLLSFFPAFPYPLGSFLFFSCLPFPLPLPVFFSWRWGWGVKVFHFRQESIIEIYSQVFGIFFFILRLHLVKFPRLVLNSFCSLGRPWSCFSFPCLPSDQGYRYVPPQGLLFVLPCYFRLANLHITVIWSRSPVSSPGKCKKLHGHWVLLYNIPERVAQLNRLPRVNFKALTLSGLVRNCPIKSLHMLFIGTAASSPPCCGDSGTQRQQRRPQRQLHSGITVLALSAQHQLLLMSRDFSCSEKANESANSQYRKMIRKNLNCRNLFFKGFLLCSVMPNAHRRTCNIVSKTKPEYHTANE